MKRYQVLIKKYYFNKLQNILLFYLKIIHISNLLMNTTFLSYVLGDSFQFFFYKYNTKSKLHKKVKGTTIQLLLQLLYMMEYL